jgi:osmotically-inducible protein OsmY
MCIAWNTTKSGNDAALAAQVASALAAVLDGRRGERIEASVDEGWVRLRGEVRRYDRKLAACTCVRCLWGVRGLTDLVEVRPYAASASWSKRLLLALRRVLPAHRLRRSSLRRACLRRQL